MLSVQRLELVGRVMASFQPINQSIRKVIAMQWTKSVFKVDGLCVNQLNVTNISSCWRVEKNEWSVNSSVMTWHWNAASDDSDVTTRWWQAVPVSCCCAWKCTIANGLSSSTRDNQSIDAERCLEAQRWNGASPWMRRNTRTACYIIFYYFLLY